MIGVVALVAGITLLVLFVGYSYGRWETEQHYDSIVAELEDTIDALLPSGITVRDV